MWTARGSAASSASASNRSTSRLPSCATVCGSGGADVECDARRRCRVVRPAPVTRGTRKSPTTMRRDGRRDPAVMPSAGPTARGTKSIGTNHDRPSRTGGAGSDTTRPATDASAWPGVRAIVCVFVETAGRRRAYPRARSGRTASRDRPARTSPGRSRRARAAAAGRHASARCRAPASEAERSAPRRGPP